MRGRRRGAAKGERKRRTSVSSFRFFFPLNKRDSTELPLVASPPSGRLGLAGNFLVDTSGSGHASPRL